MGALTPQWLYSALDSALVGVGATVDQEKRRAEVQAIIDGWNAEGRTFHNARYLGSVFEHLDELEGAALQPDLIRVAFAYRGALEEVGWEDTELSASPAAVPQLSVADRLSAIGVLPEQIAEIQQLIDQISLHHPLPDDMDAKIIIDADLAVLAGPPQLYRKMLEGLREEAPHLDMDMFLRQRHKAIKQLLRRRNIFFSPLGKGWDEPARENLEAELAAVERKIAARDDDDEAIVEDSDDTAPVVIRGSALKAARALREQTQSNAVPAPLRVPIAERSFISRQDEDDLVAETSTLESVEDVLEARRKPRR